MKLLIALDRRYHGGNQSQRDDEQGNAYGDR
jgi:hypothetical protein